MSVSFIATIAVIIFLVIFLILGLVRGFLRILLTTFSLIITRKIQQETLDGAKSA